MELHDHWTRIRSRVNNADVMAAHLRKDMEHLMSDFQSLCGQVFWGRAEARLELANLRCTRPRRAWEGSGPPRSDECSAGRSRSWGSTVAERPPEFCRDYVMAACHGRAATCILRRSVVLSKDREAAFRVRRRSREMVHATCGLAETLLFWPAGACRPFDRTAARLCCGRGC